MELLLLLLRLFLFFVDGAVVIILSSSPPPGVWSTDTLFWGWFLGLRYGQFGKIMMPQMTQWEEPRRTKYTQTSRGHGFTILWPKNVCQTPNPLLSNVFIKRIWFPLFWDFTLVYVVGVRGHVTLRVNASEYTSYGDHKLHHSWISVSKITHIQK